MCIQCENVRADADNSASNFERPDVLAPLFFYAEVQTLIYFGTQVHSRDLDSVVNILVFY